MEPHGKSYVAKGDWNLLGMRPTSGAGGPACTLQSPHTIQDRRGGMKPTKPTNVPAPRFSWSISHPTVSPLNHPRKTNSAAAKNDSEVLGSKLMIALPKYFSATSHYYYF